MTRSSDNRNIGFGGRTFLTKEEWLTYRRRAPVRYIRKNKFKICQICGKPEIDGNKFQNAHRVGFILGVIDLGLTPEYLDRDENILTTHQKICNKAAELNLEQSMQFLLSNGIVDLPDFLDENVLTKWQELKSAV